MDPLNWYCLCKIYLHIIWAAFIRMTASLSESCLQLFNKVSPMSPLNESTTLWLLVCASSCGRRLRGFSLMWLELILFEVSPPRCARQYQFIRSLVDESYNNASSSLTALMQMILTGTSIQKPVVINKGVGGAIGKALAFGFETGDGRGFESCPGKSEFFTWKGRGSEPTLSCRSRCWIDFVSLAT